MANVPETNKKLWSTLRRIYTAQRDLAQNAVSELSALGDENSDLVKDATARDELRSALARQKGHLRFAESQLALVDVMNGYWGQKSVEVNPVRPRKPVPSSNLLSSNSASRPLASRIA